MTLTLTLAGTEKNATERMLYARKNPLDIDEVRVLQTCHTVALPAVK